MNDSAWMNQYETCLDGGVSCPIWLFDVVVRDRSWFESVICGL